MFRRIYEICRFERHAKLTYTDLASLLTEDSLKTAVYEPACAARHLDVEAARELKTAGLEADLRFSQHSLRRSD